mmetsp:Transcript_16023/g.49573  ORF Transcript_16023/g.49573 Transcript_16023/m.49573 type:complete len:230 (-) Transcript_16023:63-752(-)
MIVRTMLLALAVIRPAATLLRVSSRPLARGRARAPRPSTALGALRGKPGRQPREQVVLPPMNDKITADLVRVVIDAGEAPDEILGIIPLAEALDKAGELGVDLVMIAEKSDPPVCKIVDYGKLRYQKEKKKKEQAKKAKTNEIKEVKMSYKIGEGDYEVRRKRGAQFIKNGNRVKLTIQFRGREQQHMSLGDELIEKFINHMVDDGANVAKTKTIREGRDLSTILSLKA